MKQLKERNETQARVGIDIDHFENVLWAYGLLATPVLPETLCIHDDDGKLRRRLVKNVFLFWFGISFLFGTIQCVCRY